MNNLITELTPEDEQMIADWTFANKDNPEALSILSVIDKFFTSLEEYQKEEIFLQEFDDCKDLLSKVELIDDDFRFPDEYEG